MVYSEHELVMPTLEALAAEGGRLSTARIHRILREKLSPAGRDLEILRGRNDDRFSQIVRNLKSHNTLENLGYAIYINGEFQITDKGTAFLNETSPIHNSLVDQGFSNEQIEHTAKYEYENVVIEEGAARTISAKQYDRSKKLADYARKSFSDEQGRIWCVGCGFEGNTKYGEHGKGLIDIHHLRPLHIRAGKVEQVDLATALGAVTPLCPNCHRIVHRKRAELINIRALRNITGYQADRDFKFPHQR